MGVRLNLFLGYLYAPAVEAGSLVPVVWSSLAWKGLHVFPDDSVLLWLGL